MDLEHDEDDDDDDDELEWNEERGKREFKDLYQKTQVDTKICLIPVPRGHGVPSRVR